MEGTIKVTTCEQMRQLSHEKKSVWVKSWKRSNAAAFLIGWQVKTLIDWLERGEFTVYEPPVKFKKEQKWFKSKLIEPDF